MGLAPEVPPPVPAEVDKDLVTILSWKRPHGHESSACFEQWLSNALTGYGAEVTEDEGNLVVEIQGSDGSDAEILFSCHMDTVHTIKPKEPWTQKLTYDANFGHIMLDTKDASAGNCLGADDGVGVWIMMQMVKAKVPGCYVFHCGEEVGGIGSRALLAKHRGWLSYHQAAIAFDRPGTDEVIITQGGQSCASQQFGQALADMLTKFGQGHLAYRTSTRGIFTDTKVYRGVIPECINIGVGYEFQHGTNETLDYAHAHALMTACVAMPWADLLQSVSRDPKAADAYDIGAWGRAHSSYNGWKQREIPDLDDEDWGYYGYGGTAKPDAKKAAGVTAPAATPAAPQADDSLSLIHI